jgi:hypothetical protein
MTADLSEGAGKLEAKSQGFGACACRRLLRTIKGQQVMPRRTPWHSILQRVCHNNTRCTEGNNIERRNLRSGTGGKPLCLHCARLNAAGL